MSAIPPEKHEKIYNRIIKFYDLAEDLIDTVEHEKTKDPIAQLDLVEPIVEQIEKATDILAKEYRGFAQTGKKPGMFARKRIESALSEIYLAIELCKQNVGSKKDGD